MKFTIFCHIVATVVGSSLCPGATPTQAVAPAVADGLVGHWTFDDGSGRDLTAYGNDMKLGRTEVYPLGSGRACLKLTPQTGAASIPIGPASPLAIERGTFAFWLNLGVKEAGTVLEYDNRAVQLMVYRSHFQPRFRGEGRFRFGSGLLGEDWPDFLLRESAFYPHERAVTGEGEWHHFAVAYDDRAKKITGWRDGALISVVDLSTVAMEPLNRQKLKSIVTGGGFSGFIDDLRIYNRVLTGAEVQGVFEAERAVHEGRNDAVDGKRKMEVYSFQESDRSLYRAWLQYSPVQKLNGREMLSRIVAEGSDPTVRTAAAELAAAVTAMVAQPSVQPLPTAGAKVVLGTPETSAWIRQHAAALGLERIKLDGYVIKALKDADGPTLVVAARVPPGVVFGAFDLIRRIQGGGDLGRLDRLENPQVPIRMVNHWDIWRGFPHDDWHGKELDPFNTESNRSNSIFSWEELRTGDTRRIRDWTRLLASAGWNAICPTEINWEFRNNFLEHLAEVKTLAGIFRDYGIKLYWTPNYLLALRKETADRLYAAVPDFGGYLLKLGSEAQGGDPRPRMVNPIADNLKPYGGLALVRAFVYGKYRYSDDDIRSLNPYDVIAREDGRYRDNVVIVSKGSPLDWDFSAPIPALDGAIRKNLYGSELVIAKSWPVSWVEKWKWWLEQDNYHNGPGSLNKFDATCILGVAMIRPAPAWTSCPLNMVNYYGLGRLAFNPDLTVAEVYTEWIRLTFGDDLDVRENVKTILLLSDDATRKLYLYRGYRGIWVSSRDAEDLTQNKTPHTITPEGLGVVSPEMRKRVLDQYAPGLREIYGDPVRGEEFFASFNFKSLDYKLSSGRTVIQDVYANLDEAVQLAERMPRLWQRLQGKIDPRRYQHTLESLRQFIAEAQEQRGKMVSSFEAVTGRKYAETMAGLAPAKAAAQHLIDVRNYGAKADGTTNDAGAINEAIAACSAAGGGTVFFPAGVYGTGSIQLKSNITLALDPGAVLRALAGAMDSWEPNPHDQGLMDPAYYHWRASLIWGENLENVKILGPGSLDGSALTRSSKVPRGTGDKGIALKQCKNVEIRNLDIEQGGHYAILLTGCERVLVDNVTINTGRDGLDLMQSRNVTVTNCHIDSVRREDGRPAGGDDAIKLGSDLSLGAAYPCENITIRDCMLAAGCNALQFGTETAGSFKNIRFENLRILGAGKAGIGITSNDGSVIEDVSCRNITMTQTFVPFFLKVSDVARVPAGVFRRGTIRNVTFENITATDCYSSIRRAEMPSVIWGKPGSPIENIVFTRVRITAKGGHPDAEAALNPAENDERFPQDVGALPAFAWYLRHVKAVRFVDCHFGFDQNDGRPAFVVDDGEKIALAGCELPQGAGLDSAIAVRNGSGVTILPRNPAPSVKP